ncbi:TIGR03745 family integrating conjugative element membrane protein [Providencia hangzhouensis]|uniref:Integrating conjugative element membrane protein, PFL_4702 family n=1 Tax=Providencia rettgeri TaxID=587 RepID=A0A9N8GWQ7_PRORE|nr:MULTISPECIES: TIGR03745 family integrating conjugative element membrane protein [Providencia]MCB4855645.1 TIGR03745 family integrating conjugative element membrane protein [Providencia rettgeri]MCW4539364.1 TIGR03745 family integrating conjugative element membrane protein [Providencia rettgeri]MDX4117356.1 TIGR03745 family integrating conjugative element membrane protein [Providencia rettgeri]UPQ40174.1 TIGR03745 family integrating conjugative element membrane protein [Providencia rettgeri]
MIVVTRFFIHTCHRLSTVTATIAAFLFGSIAQAALPKVEPPTSGGGGGLMDTLKGYVNDGIVIGGLVVAAAAFIVVAIAAVTTFHEVREGKAGWGKFGTIIVVGVVLIVAVVWLAGKAATIIF